MLGAHPRPAARSPWPGCAIFCDGRGASERYNSVGRGQALVLTEPPRAVQPPPTRLPSFRDLFETESSYVWTTLKRLGVKDADLEDMVHECFLAVHRLLGQFDPRRPVRPWLFGIAFREAANYRRRAQHRYEVAAEAEAVDETPSVDEHVAAKEARSLLLRGLQTLDLDRRAVLVMHDIDGATMPEIAQTLAIPLNTAYSRLRLARADLGAAVRRLRLVGTKR